MEHVLVNHMFFEQFPFQDRDEGLCDEFIAICAVYALHTCSVRMRNGRADGHDGVYGCDCGDIPLNRPYCV